MNNLTYYPMPIVLVVDSPELWGFAPDNQTVSVESRPRKSKLAAAPQHSPHGGDKIHQLPPHPHLTNFRT